MKSENFFKWVWNINSLVILFTVTVILLTISYEIIKPFFREQPREEQALSLAKDINGEEKWSLGYPTKIGKTDYYYVALESVKLEINTRSKIENFSGSGGSYKTTRAKNVIFINAKTNKSNWLFDSVNQLITEITPLGLNENKADYLTKAISYEVINRDSNNDGVLDHLDKRTFALSKVDGSQYSHFIEGYSHIIESAINQEGNLFVVFIDNDEVHSMIIDLQSFKVIDQKALPKVNDS
ncbi:MAG: hypothetical protein HRT37_25035 [Alteromonadaceae bacterium]|nr:hypothetical protein [Alteromonadaceae bacterium]